MQFVLHRCLTVFLIIGLSSLLSWGHFQKFEDVDSTSSSPIVIDNVETAFAWYGTVEYPGDVDYFMFDGTQGQDEILYLLFPLIEDTITFFPSMALIGPGLPSGTLDDSVFIPEGAGVQQLTYSPDQLDEMAHGRIYKYPTPMEITLPATGTYYVAIWHDDGEMGRYCFSHGSSHDGGSSDPDADTKIEEFWTSLTLDVEIPNLAADAMPMNVVRISAGDFIMGSPDGEVGRSDDEVQHTATIVKSFYMGQCEVTQSQWKAVMQNNPAQFADNPNRPVETVSWDDCQAFINQLNAISDLDGLFRLPTEAEWEYACRAGTESRFYWGDDPSLSEVQNYAWIDTNSNAATHDAGTKYPNPSGLFDMSGNVSEWCQDWYADYQGTADGSSKVVRGGSWQSAATMARSAYRASYAPDSTKLNNLGFRIVFEPSGGVTSNVDAWALYE